jgi:hypothetical protein
VPERDAITVNLGDGFLLIAAGVRREKNGDLRADVMLQNGRVLFADRAVLNRDEAVAAWAAKATTSDRPTADRMTEAIREYLLPDALAQLQEEPKRATQADAIVGMLLEEVGDFATDVAEAVELFHDPSGDAYATVPLGDHRETHPLRSKAFRQWLARRFHERTGKTPNAQALVDATNVLAGKALFDGPERAVFTRLAELNGVIYLDLCDERWRVVAIDATGWRVADEVPVRFRRTRGMLPLPIPASGGDLRRLRSFVNVGSDGDWVLLVSWLVGAFRSNGPYPVLVLHGEQGSAKSSATRALRSSVDPNAAPIRTAPRDERDLMISARNGWCLAFDNLSHLSVALSDGLCRLSTGGGFATRELYADLDETILDAQRPIILNGIEEIATRGDLLDRAIILYLPSIPEERRQPESTLWTDYEAARPALLGALLDAVSTAVRNEPSTHLDRLPRMADFARWVMAAEPALPWESGAFLTAYRANREAANDLTLDSSLVSQAVRDFARDLAAAWIGTASDLLKALTEHIDEATTRQKGWPANGRSLSNALRRLAPNLRAAGVMITFDIRQAGTGKRTLTIERDADAASPASPASQATGGRDARDDESPGYSSGAMFTEDAETPGLTCLGCGEPLQTGAHYYCADCEAAR